MNFRAILFLVLVVTISTSARATSINLNVDSAPNVFGSPDWTPWWDAARTEAINGTFVNMANSQNPANSGITNFDIRDTVVYSFGDLGRRLHFVYWVPNETIASLTAKNFEVGLDYVWDGVFYNDYFGSEWVTPSSWIEQAGGVIGSGGFAWWGAFGVNTQEALDNDIKAWTPLQGDITFRARVSGEPIVSLTVHHNVVPDVGASGLLLIISLGALFAGRIKMKCRSQLS